MMLEVKDLVVTYGVITALKGVSIHVDRGEIVTIIGANGAGKTSLMNAIAGVVPYSAGSIRFNGQPMPNSSHKVVRAGVALAPEGRRIFGNLTVRENLVMGAYMRSDKNTVSRDIDEVFDIFPRLKERINQGASTLSGGEQQMLAIGRAMMSKPQLLMLDEPSLGLAPLLVQDIFQTIKLLHERGTTILLVEQNANQALSVADRAYVIQTGTVIKEGSGAELLHDPQVEEAYLGARHKSK